MKTYRTFPVSRFPFLVFLFFLMCLSRNVMTQDCVMGLTLVTPSDGSHLAFNPTTGLWDFKINTFTPGGSELIRIGGFTFDYYEDNINFNNITLDDSEFYINQNPSNIQISAFESSNSILMNTNGEFVTGSMHVTPVASQSFTERDAYGVYFGGIHRYFIFGKGVCVFSIESSPRREDFVQIEGKLKTFYPVHCQDVGVVNRGLPDAEVTISYENTQYPFSEVLTSGLSGGQFKHYYPKGPQYRMSPLHTDNKGCGVDADDVNKTRRIILGIDSDWDYVWQFFAADVSGNNYVSGWDLILMQRQILGISEFSDANGWKFLNTTQYYDEIDKVLALGSTAEIDNYRIVDDLGSASNDNNFFVVKGGDVDLTCSDCSGLRHKEKVVYKTTDLNVEVLHEDGKNAYDITLDNEENYAVYELNLSFSEEIEEIEIEGLDENDISTHIIEGNNLKLLITNMEREFDRVPRIKVYTAYDPFFSVNVVEDSEVQSMLYTEDEKYLLHPAVIHKGVKGGCLVYPNPASEIINIFTQVELEGIALITMDGRVIRRNRVNGRQCSLNVEEYPSGVYILRVSTQNGETNMRKVIIQ